MCIRDSYCPRGHAPCGHGVSKPLDRDNLVASSRAYQVQDGSSARNHIAVPRRLGPLVRIVDASSDRRALCSGGSDNLVVPTVKLSTVGGKVFSAAAPRIWNSLSDDVVSAQSLSSFVRLLKTFSSSDHILTLCMFCLCCNTLVNFQIAFLI